MITIIMVTTLMPPTLMYAGVIIYVSEIIIILKLYFQGLSTPNKFIATQGVYLCLCVCVCVCVRVCMCACMRVHSVYKASRNATGMSAVLSVLQLLLL